MPSLTQAQLQSLSSGISTSLTNLQTRIEDRVLAETLPLVGAGLEAAAEGGEAALNTTETLGSVLAQALQTLAAAGDQAEEVVEAALTSALAAAGFSGTLIGVTVLAGEVRLSLETERFGTYIQSLATDLGLAGLDVATEGSATVGAGFAYDLDFVLQAGSFTVDTLGADEVVLDLTINGLNIAPTTSVDGQAYDAADAGTIFDGTISINLNDPAAVTAAGMATASIAATLAGNTDVAIDLTLGDQGDMTPPITATLDVQWDFSSANINPDNTNANFGQQPTVTFRNVTMDLGSFMERFVAPLVRTVNDLFEPIQPILNMLDSRITVLEDLPGLDGAFDRTGDGRVTLLDLVGFLDPNADLAAIEKVITLVNDVAAWADFLDGTGFGAGDLRLGDIAITGDIRDAGFSLDSAATSIEGIADDLAEVIGGLSGGSWDGIGGGRDILDSLTNHDIFKLPIIGPENQWADLFFGRDVDLVEVDLPPITIGTGGYRPILPPIVIFPFPVIKFTTEARADITLNFDFGFSTRGLFDPNLDAIDGFYVIDQAGEEIRLSASFRLGLELDILVASVKGDGDVTGVIEMELVDGATSGRLYFDEFIDALNANPFSIFEASGAITLGFGAAVEAFGKEVWRWASPRVVLGDFSFDSVNQGIDWNLATKSGAVLDLHVGDRADERTDPGNISGTDIDEAEQVYIIADTTGTGIQVLTTVEAAGGVEARMTEGFSGITKITADGVLGNDQIVLAQTLAISAHLTGGVGDDMLGGATLGDTLEGGADDDVLFGFGGNDLLQGGADDDLLNGGDGFDTMDGGTGSDRVTYYGLTQGIGIDLGTGNAWGGALGDDFISIEHFDGTEKADSITGSQGAGSFTGYGGNDTLVSGSHVQELYGNAGNDRLESGGSGDTLSGGMGNDLYVVKGLNTVVDENALDEIAPGAGGGNDTVQAWVDVDLSGRGGHIERIDLFGLARNVTGDGAGNLINGSNLANVIDGDIGGDTINGNGGDDTLLGGLGSGADVLRGDAGDDSLDGGQLGNDSLYGGDGKDTLTGNGGANRLEGGKGGDVFRADSDDSVIEGDVIGTDMVWAQGDFTLAAFQHVEILSVRSLDAGDWRAAYNSANRTQELIDLARTVGVNAADLDGRLTGNGLAQVLIGTGGGSNILAGLAGADTLIGDGANDTADYSASTAGVTINLQAESQTGGHAQGDVLRNITRITGSGLADSILAKAISPGPGSAEFFAGGGGNDTLKGYGNDDTLHGDAGNDSLDGGTGNDSLTGGGGQDTILGGDGDDSLWGLSGNDSLVGGNGNDTLQGHDGSDTLDGGAGNDRYVVEGGDTIRDSAGTDTVVAYVDFVLGSSVVIERLEAGYNLTGDEGADIDLTGSSAAQSLIGNDGDNVLIGLAGADTIDGRTGIDEVSYRASLTGVNVNLNRTSQTGGHAAGDVLTSIERVRGSMHDDRIVGKSTFQTGDITATILWGEGGDDHLSDTLGRNTLYGGMGDDTLIGSGSSGSRLEGGNGNDSLDGGAATSTGGDTLIGGAGDDTLRVTSEGDVVEEVANGGSDLLIVDVTTWVMDGTQAHIEDVELEDNFSLTANALANRITGSAVLNTIRGEAGNDTILGLGGNDNLYGGNGTDSLDGGSGADRMEGGGGGDTYVVDNTGDAVVETQGSIALGGVDLVIASVSFTLGTNVENLTLTGAAAINATGNGSNNRLTGNDAANRLNGKTGADILIGGKGNDVYVTDGGDTITELLGGGIDRVESSVSYTLGENVENLTLTGTNAINGTGTNGSNTIIGNTAANVLTGKLGADVMKGGRGNDTYVADSFDTITELAGEGVDTVKSDATFRLGANIENLVLTGSAAINGTGNALVNKITGNAGANVLKGGGGADRFIFSTTLGAVDEITDFTVGVDTIVLDASVFAALEEGDLTAAAFRSNLTGRAMDATDRIIYNSATGDLYYDRDGTGGALRTHFATIDAGLALTRADFDVI